MARKGPHWRLRDRGHAQVEAEKNQRYIHSQSGFLHVTILHIMLIPLKLAFKTMVEKKTHNIY